MNDGWEFAREITLTDSPKGEELLRRSEWLRNREGWHYAIPWADNADVLVEIDQAARPRPEAGRAHPAQAEAARARSTSTAALSPSPSTAGPAAPPAQPGPELTRRMR